MYSKKFVKLKIFILVGAFAIVLALSATCSLFAGASVAFAESYFSEGKSAYLIDSATGTVLYARNEKARLPIASMVKIMTSLLTFEAVERGDVSLDDDVAVSDLAASMGGSQVFLDAGTTHKLDDLLKTVIVASANDSCVALAEHISGSVSAFVARMNERAKELGMNDTSFKNCTGLPAAESFSCAQDVAKMFGELIKHPHYFEHAKVWLEDYMHPDGRATSITNTNKLVRFYNGCDGGKTGYTGEAKFCLAATAKRDGMRVIAVIIGASGSKERNAAVSGMFDFAFANYSNATLVKSGELIDNSIEVIGGKKADLNVTVSKDVSQLMSRKEQAEFELKYELEKKVKAPVKAGDVVGKALLVKNGEIISETDVVAAEDVKAMSLYDAIERIGRRWGIG